MSETTYVPLPDPWPDLIVEILGTTLGPCDACCTPETDGDLCYPCKEVFERVEYIVRRGLRGGR